VYGGVEKGIENVNRKLEGKRPFDSSRPRWEDDHNEIGCGDLSGLGSSG
jgi:hypothetical protein